MRNFAIAMTTMALATVASAQFDCTGYAEASAADCAAYPEFAELMDGLGYPWELVPLTTSDGYDLTLIRIKGYGGAAVAPEDRPLLLHADFAGDATNWSWATNQPFSGLLAERGYDVWLLNRRGTNPRTHQTLNPNTDASYWDFTHGDVANKDLTAAISKILETRQADTLGCKKVQLLTYGLGGQEALILLADKASVANKYIERVINVAPCHVPAD